MQDKVSSDINAALKRGDKATAEALRLLKSSLMNAKISAGHELSDEEAFKVIRKEIKSRIEARDMYAANDRSELAAKEEFERTVYAAYVPEQLGELEIDKVVEKVASDLATDVTFSLLMPAVMKAVAGKADGRLVSERVKKYIEGK